MHYITRLNRTRPKPPNYVTIASIGYETDVLAVRLARNTKYDGLGGLDDEQDLLSKIHRALQQPHFLAN